VEYADTVGGDLVLEGGGGGGDDRGSKPGDRLAGGGGAAGDPRRSDAGDFIIVSFGICLCLVSFGSGAEDLGSATGDLVGCACNWMRGLLGGVLGGGNDLMRLI